ncbi:hypothetical protein EVAR_46118_1 [Eumeta japonica]|uniref:Uncharacterized protein n=1 Tax=Eumeta variegata TaxID=151549 RepID=A0A4C1XRI4_EUMVA|nr:hypothetical protein EVAR_46118_1 [Eumeta japonica]
MGTECITLIYWRITCNYCARALCSSHGTPPAPATPQYDFALKNVINPPSARPPRQLRRAPTPHLYLLRPSPADDWIRGRWGDEYRGIPAGVTP